MNNVIRYNNNNEKNTYLFGVIKKAGITLFTLILICACQKEESAESRFLKVSENGRYLEYKNGKPFLYLGDTAWELFHRLDREEATEYLQNRAEKGITVIQG